MGHEFQSDLRRWDIVAGLCQQIDARTYVEVGAKEGRTVGYVLQHCPQVRAIAIDPWCRQDAGTDSSRETYEKWNFAEIERQFWENVCNCETRNEPDRVHSAYCTAQRCQMIREDSHAASGRFERPIPALNTGNCLVFIDALHDYESVKQDIALWWPLVRQGGYLCGHDYNHKWPGVMRAVAEHFNLMDVCLGPDSMWWVQKPHSVRAAA